MERHEDEDDYCLGSRRSPAHYHHSSDPAISLVSDEEDGGEPLSSSSSSLSLFSTHSSPLPLGGASQPPTPSSVSACVPFKIWPQLALSTDLILVFPHKSAVRSVLRLGLIPGFEIKLQKGNTGDLEGYFNAVWERTADSQSSSQCE